MTQVERKAIKKYLKKYEQSNKRTLFDCYKNPSAAKFRAMVDCRMFMDEIGGDDLRIISYNSSIFTVGFWKELKFYVITPYHVYYCEV